MERSEVVASLESLQHLLVEDDRLGELLTSVHHTVTYSVKFRKRFQGTVDRVGENLEDKFHTHCVLRNLLLDYFLATVSSVELDERSRKTDFLDAALCKDSLCLHLEELVFD